MRLRPLLAATLTAACATSQRPAARPRAPYRYVMVSAGTPLRTSAARDAPSLTAPTELTFRRVRELGDQVELETVPGDARQCAPVLVPPGGMRLRFFVPATALAQVLSRPLSLSGPDGTLAVQPGVAVHEGSRRTAPAELVHAGLRLTLVLTPTVGREHPAPRAERTITRAERLAPGTRATLPDGVVMEVGRETNVYVLSRRATAEGARVTVTTPCARLEAVVPERAVLPVMEMDIGDGDDAPSARWRVRRGARFRWPDGSPAGRASGVVRVADEGRADGTSRCFHVPLVVEGGPASAQPLDAEVCADQGDVRRLGAAP